MKDLKIWVSYHKDSLYDEFGLGSLDKNIFIPYNLSSTPKEDNINYIHSFWNEICTMYYVWKNKKKSKWIGFCGYRRLFDNIIDINDDECLYITRLELSSSICKLFCEEHFKGDMLNILSYMKDNNYMNEFNEMLNSNEHILNDCFIMSWDNFNRLCEFMFGVLFHLDKIYNLDMKPENYIKRYHEIYEKYNLKYTKDYQTRAFSFIAERLISVWITCNTKYKCVQKKVYLVDGTPKILFEKNCGTIDFEKSKEVIDSLVKEMLSNNFEYKFKICCDKCESDIIPLCLERKISLINLLSSYNIPDYRYKIKFKGYTNHYNNNNCVVVFKQE